LRPSRGLRSRGRFFGLAFRRFRNGDYFIKDNSVKRFSGGDWGYSEVAAVCGGGL
jgi:hypothetical protein